MSPFPFRKNAKQRALTQLENSMTQETSASSPSGATTAKGATPTPTPGTDPNPNPNPNPNPTPTPDTNTNTNTTTTTAKFNPKAISNTTSVTSSSSSSSSKSPSSSPSSSSSPSPSPSQCHAGNASHTTCSASKMDSTTTRHGSKSKGKSKAKGKFKPRSRSRSKSKHQVPMDNGTRSPIKIPDPPLSPNPQAPIMVHDVPDEDNRHNRRYSDEGAPQQKKNSNKTKRSRRLSLPTSLPSLQAQRTHEWGPCYNNDNGSNPNFANHRYNDDQNQNQNQNHDSSSTSTSVSTTPGRQLIGRLKSFRRIRSNSRCNNNNNNNNNNSKNSNNRNISIHGKNKSYSNHVSLSNHSNNNKNNNKNNNNGNINNNYINHYNKNGSISSKFQQTKSQIPESFAHNINSSNTMSSNTFSPSPSRYASQDSYNGSHCSLNLKPLHPQNQVSPHWDRASPSPLSPKSPSPTSKSESPQSSQSVSSSILPLKDSKSGTGWSSGLTSTEGTPPNLSPVVDDVYANSGSLDGINVMQGINDGLALKRYQNDDVHYDDMSSPNEVSSHPRFGESVNSAQPTSTSNFSYMESPLFGSEICSPDRDDSILYLTPETESVLKDQGTENTAP